jgi:hypothetical protein
MHLGEEIRELIVHPVEWPQPTPLPQAVPEPVSVPSEPEEVPVS